MLPDRDIFINLLGIESKSFFSSERLDVKRKGLIIYLMDIKTLRWQKSRQLVEREGGISRFAERVGRTQQQANQFAGPNPTKGIGNKIARLIEQSFGLAHGYLDRMDSADSVDLSIPASSSVDAIRQASRTAERFIESRKQWLTARPQALYMVRSDLRKILLDASIEITKETDEEFFFIRHGKTLRIDLFIPFPGFNVYRYQGSESMTLPEALAIPVCQTSEAIAFYLIPNSVLSELPDNTQIKLDETSTRLNGVDVSQYLNNLSVLR